MSGLVRDCLVLPLLLAATFLTAVVAAPISHDGGTDIGELLDRARSAYDLEGEDAVILLESRREDWTTDGRRSRSIHRIVYIGTRHGIGSHADLRVPYDSSRERLTVESLRTWRLSDETWTESGPTARVETLPFALDHAPDYAHLREMMLLHDGVELPCVLETSYTIEDLEPYRPGTDGLWSFAMADPVLISRFVLGFPPGHPPLYAAVGIAGEPELGHDDRTGLDTVAFEIGPLQPRPYPWTREMAYHVPRIAWSTWDSWEALGRELQGRFTTALRLDDDLRAALAETLEKTGSVAEKMERVLEFVGESTRAVHYEFDGWKRPRPAARTWSTAYGDRFDRTALAAALLREVGVQAELALVGPVLGAEDPRVPTLAWATETGLWVRGEGVEGYFGPDSRAVPGGAALWRPGGGGTPVAIWPAGNDPSRIDLRLDLSYDAENKSWTGTGVLTATDASSPYPRMVGLGTQAKDYLDELAGTLLEGAEVNGYNLAVFDPATVTVGFSVKAPAEERDELERLHLALATPAAFSSLLERAAVHVQEERRQSPVELPAVLELQVELYLDTEDVEVIHVPEETVIENRAGRFESRSEQDEEDDELHVVRTLVFSKADYAAEEWTDLRALLLAEEDEGHRLVLAE